MRLVVFAALAAILSPFSARAQNLSLTESDALSRLSSESPRVRAIRASVDVARADVLFVARWPNPQFILDRESVAGITEYLTMVAQPLPITGRRGLEIQAASSLVEAASSRSDEAVRRARADLRIAFNQLVVAQLRERELAVAVDRLRGLADVLAKREAAGDAAGFDRLRAEREVLDLNADRLGAAIDRSRAQAILASFFAASDDASRIVAVGRAEVPPPLPTLDALIERADATRGELVALRKEVESADFSLRAAERRRLPEPQIVAGTKSSNFDSGGIGSVVTAQASIPVFDRGRPERALALARARQAQARIDAFRQTLRADVATWRAAVEQRRVVAEQYRAAAVSSADQIDRIAQVSYDAGERSILELLDAYRITSAARLRQASLDLSVREAEIELEFVSGWEMP
jgi:outer membrane protein, heavy metal efflux system